MNAQQLTILIPTYNRPHYLIPLLQFFKTGLDLNRVRIKVLDGSEAENREVADICGSSGFEYDFYGAQVHLIKRWGDGVKGVTTEFASILADDDILQPQGVYACLDFLQNHPGYSAAHGKYIWFAQQGEESLIYPGYANFSLEQASPLERLFAFLSAYAPITYGVYRSSVLKTAYAETISATDESDLCFIELLSGCLPVVAGKVKKLEVSYYGRRMGPPTPRPQINYPKIVFAGNFSHRYGRVKAAIKKHILKQGIDSQIADDAIDYSFGAWFGKLLGPEILARHFNSIKQFVDSISEP